VTVDTQARYLVTQRGRHAGQSYPMPRLWNSAVSTLRQGGLSDGQYLATFIRWYCGCEWWEDRGPKPCLRHRRAGDVMLA